jgi:hypothetical protein
MDAATAGRPAGPPAAPEQRDRARWEAAEARLYPLVLSDPELYEAAVTLMAEARDVLRSECDTVSALAEIEAAAVLARCPSAPATTARGVDPHTVVDAPRPDRRRERTRRRPDQEHIGTTPGRPP